MSEDPGGRSARSAPTAHMIPTGSVTFLFTDIEGSTRLAQQHGRAWEALRARHHAILREAIAGQGGYVFQIIGDAFCAAFHTARAAVAAAVGAQRGLQTEAWEGAVIRVRMGIHTGSAELQANGEYQGYLTLSRVQRLMSAGHGGQVLLSHAATELAAEDLPEGVSLRDLGEHRLKDFPRPERIFQLDIQGFVSDFPPPKTLAARRHNLPAQLTSFIGREAELAEVTGAVQSHRLVTLTGAGGTGKTRLSLQVAAGLLDAFPDGVWFIELASLSDPDLIPHTILLTLRLNEQPGKPALQSLIEALAETTTLLILDNCEHLIEACARLTAALLAVAPRLHILASSREALGVGGEMAWHLPSLALPDPRHLPPLDQFIRFEAVRLFADRAALAQPHFLPTPDNAPAIAQICARLDGIPLAIELAAARVKTLSVEQIAARLDDRFRLLTGGSRTALPRQQTLRALIDWSYNLLSGPEKTLFRRLAVFVGGWTLEAAEGVCAFETEALDVLDLLSHLVDKSLVIADDGAGAVRYRLLETTRQYALEVLLATNETGTCRDQHLGFFLTLAEAAEPALHGPQQAQWMARLAREHDNLAAALEWSLSAEPHFGLRMAGALTDYWDTHGHLSEGRKWLEATLAATASLPPTLARVKAIFGLVVLASRQGDIPLSLRLVDESLALARSLGDKAGIANGLHMLGMVKIYFENAIDEAERLFGDALAIRREIGDRRGIGQALGPLASCALNRYDYALAEQWYAESLALFREVGDDREVAGALWNLAEVAWWRRDYRASRARAEDSLAVYRTLEDTHGIATALRTLSQAAANQGERAQALDAARQSVAAFRHLEDRSCLGLALAVLARQLLAVGDLPAAEATAQEAAAALTEVGDKIAAAGAMDVWGRVALRRGDLDAARGHFQDGLALQQEVNNRHSTPSLLEGLAAWHLAHSPAPDALPSGSEPGPWAGEEEAVRLLAEAEALRASLPLARAEIERVELPAVGALAALRPLSVTTS